MSAINQMFVGLFSAAGAIVSGITTLVNKWYPVYTREIVNSVQWANGKAWRLGGGTGVETSDNGIDWNTIWPANSAGLNNVAGAFNDIAYGNNLYVIVGDVMGSTSAIITSPDGVTWTRRTTTHNSGLSSVAWSPTLNMFLAAGGNSSGTTAYSTDGITWTTGATMGTTRINKVAWGNGQFALLDSNGTSSVVYRSSNGTSFTPSASLSGQGTDIAYSPTLNLWALSRNNSSSSHVMTSPDLITWTARIVSGSPAAAAYGIVWNGSKFVVNSNGGGSGSSSDGITWTLVNNSVTQLGKMCAMPSGAIIAATYSDKGVAISYNSGITWGTSLAEVDSVVGQFRSNATKSISAFTYSGGRYWAASTNIGGQLYYSTDKKVWFSVTMPGGTAGTNYRAVYASLAATPYWVAPGTTGTAGQVFSSTDGFSFVLRTVSTQGTGWNDAASNGTLTALVNNDGRITWTTNGSTFATPVKPVNSLRSVVYAGGTFVAVGSSTAVYSVDGTSWTSASTSFGAFNAFRVIHDGTQFIAVGQGTASINVKVSTDGITWTTGPVAPWGATAVGNIAFNGTAYVAVIQAATNVVYVGTTLSNFATVTLPITMTSASTSSLVAVGTEFTLQTSNNAYQLTSIDNGATWTNWSTAEPIGTGTFQANIPLIGMLDGAPVIYSPFNGSTNSGFGKYDVTTQTATKYTVNPGAGALATYSVIKVGSTYIAGLGNTTTSGNISTSTNLSSWTTRSSVAAAVRSIASNADGTMIVAGTNTNSTTGILGVYSSPDGITWTQRGGGIINVTKVIWANGQFVAVGSNATPAGVIRTSTDGITWTTRYSGSSDTFTDVAFGNGVYVAVSSGSVNKFYTSTDGIAWTARGLTTFPQMYSIAFGNGTFWALGANGSSGAAYSTTDGINYSASILPSPNTINGVVWDGVSSFWATSIRGSLFKLDTQ